ncbi:hypothetical protein BpHYR1_043438 [Brachionus plicatilis]|uniref:Uncharacterized protein n=1 Tax=Brachionus plicatilis TaxID=10195 RepID=A0A3M7SUY3_BRAPC|nr:hypothetical protein BpHYR1_043438 [Brachionus plicatilis]
MGGQLFGKLSGLNFGPILEENISIHQLFFLLANKKKRVLPLMFSSPRRIGHISSKIQKNMHFFAAISFFKAIFFEANFFYSGFNKNVTQKKPRPNNVQRGRPSRPVCGSEPANFSDLAGRPKRPSRPT